MTQEGCIAKAHWQACDSCLNFDADHGCNVKENNGYHIEDGHYVICEDYEEK